MDWRASGNLGMRMLDVIETINYGFSRPPDGSQVIASPPARVAHVIHAICPSVGPSRTPVTVDEGDLPVSTAPASAHEAGPRDPRKAALSGWIGSALEYYDFALYSLSAALVF